MPAESSRPRFAQFMAASSLILTRPASEGDAWQVFFNRHGWTTHAWPLIEIQPLSPLENKLDEAWKSLGTCQAAMFVSKAAVRHFFAHQTAPSKWPDGVRAWCTGPGTRQALLKHGVPPQLIDQPAAGSTWDTEHLWPVVSAQVSPGCRVLLVRGTDESPVAMQAGQGVGRDWLAKQLAGRGAEVVWAVAYRRACPQWDWGQTDLARRAASDGSVWVFSSTQALTHLGQLLTGQDWTRSSAVATHPRIAAHAQALGFVRVLTCPPAPEDVLASLKSGL